MGLESLYTAIVEHVPKAMDLAGHTHNLSEGSSAKQLRMYCMWANSYCFRVI